MGIGAFKISVNDRRLEASTGIRKQHAANLMAFCQGIYEGRQLLILVRGANPESLQWHNAPGHKPKPLTLKAKTSQGSQGRVKEGGDYYYSDYDLLGVYELLDNGTYQRTYIHNAGPKPGTIIDQQQWSADAHEALSQNSFLQEINKYVCPGLRLFQHGTNDDFRLSGAAGNPLREGESALAFEHTGDLFLLHGTLEMRDYYHARRICWIYG